MSSRIVHPGAGRTANPSWMQRKRRRLLGMTLGLPFVAAQGVFVRPLAGAERNKAGFSAHSAAEAMKAIGAANPTPSKEIDLKAPDVAENGTLVPIEVTSRIPDTQAISIIAERNPSPLVATFEFMAGAEPYVSTRIKLMESSNLRIIVKAGGRHYQIVREVKVIQGGCA